MLNFPNSSPDKAPNKWRGNTNYFYTNDTPHILYAKSKNIFTNYTQDFFNIKSDRKLVHRPQGG
jgi:hypothetical protein